MKHEEKVQLIKELIEGMPKHAVFKLAEGVYVGPGGFLVKERDKTHKISFEEAEKNTLLMEKLKSVKPESLNTCFQTKEMYQEIKDLNKDREKIKMLGSNLLMFENEEISASLCTLNTNPNMVFKYTNENSDKKVGVHVIKTIPELETNKAPALPTKFNSRQEVEQYSQKLVKYLNAKTGENTKVVIKDIEQMSEREKKHFGITNNNLPVFGHYDVDKDTIYIFVNSKELDQIPSSAIASILVHEYGHALTKENVKLLREAAAKIVKDGDTHEEFAVVRMLSEKAEQLADAAAKEILGQLYGPYVFEEGMIYLYKVAKERGIQFVNEESTKPEHLLYKYHTLEERINTTVEQGPSVEQRVGVRPKPRA